ncbi:hypothetical protein [Microbaculum marinum]|uniref:Uncharacterized protein n=1 Tax=Microbaculum marinum TaxID=1764581 RepID=A0AAW9RKP2_9HYPH
MSARFLGLALAAIIAFCGVPAAMADQTNGGSGAEIAGPASSFSNVVDARFAVFYDRSSIVRAKNINTVTHPSTGIYCVKIPKTLDGKNINAQRLIPNVTVEWGTSFGLDLLAYYYANADSCPKSKRFVEVRTYQFPDGVPELSDNVSFIVTIP